MSIARSFAAVPPAIATKAELDQLTAHRSHPASEPHLRPDGAIAPDIQDRLRQMQETRIGELQERLSSAREGLEWGQASAQLHGKAMEDFGRSR